MDIKKVLKDAEAAITTYEWLAVTEFDAATVIDSKDVRKVLYEALVAQLDAINEEIRTLREGRRDPGTIPMTVYAEQNSGYYEALADVEGMLKEAHKELTTND